MLKILFVASESVPFIKTGGLADVVGSLPKEIKDQGIDIRVVLPKYLEMPEHYKEKLSTIAVFEVKVAWRKLYVGIQSLVYAGVTYYFIDNEYYFKRKDLYGHYDDAERYAYFCKAILELEAHVDFKPDIIHCNDWHTAILPALLKAHYPSRQTKTILTIHNLMYQGIFSLKIIEDILGINKQSALAKSLEYDNAVNYLKSGIILADYLTTVSKTYAEEIKTPQYGEGLENLLTYRQEHLVGIVNGIDFDYFDPYRDSNVCMPYTWRSIYRKNKNKEKLQSYMNLPIDTDKPLIAVISRLVQSKGLDLIAEAIETILQMDIQLVVLGTGEEKYEGMFRYISESHKNKVAVNLFFDEALAHKIYAGADIFLMPSLFEPCGIGQLIAMRYGTIPVVRETGGLKDTVTSYNEYTEEGNGFSFQYYNAGSMLATLKRALELYQEKENWGKIIKNAMREDYSWRKSAKMYLDIYAKLT